MKDFEYDKVLVEGIENFEEKIEAYASWIINGGLRFEKGWALGIACPITCPDIARALTKVAYKQGARDVTVYWDDPYTQREKFANAEDKYLENNDPWPDRAKEKYGVKNLAFVYLLCACPSFFNDLPIEKQLKNSQWTNTVFGSFKRGLDVPYTICAASNREWAHDVYPDLPADEAYIKLWNNLFEVARIDGKTDPVKEWFAHSEEMQNHAEILNKYHFHHLHYTSEIGTNCTFELPENHKWVATAVNTSSGGLKFSANMPTEEVFCVPTKFGVNGKVVSSTPMLTKSGLVLNPEFTLKDGKIIDYKAKEGKEILDAIIESDENGRFLGEVAIVPYDTPISRQGIIYYNTLFDENAGCHTAVGNAYSKCLEGGLQMSPEELEASGLNICKFHEDCIFGTKETKIVGTTYEGEDVTIFEHGAFTI